MRPEAGGLIRLHWGVNWAGVKILQEVQLPSTPRQVASWFWANIVAKFSIINEIPLGSTWISKFRKVYWWGLKPRRQCRRGLTLKSYFELTYNVLMVSDLCVYYMYFGTDLMQAVCLTLWCYAACQIHFIHLLFLCLFNAAILFTES